MSSIGRLTASILSARNENTLALANLNFDFSLVKFDAPPEFNALGAALTTKRRKNAESGSAHKTARRLGALFEQLVPPTPGLVKTYGLRVSEIAETPGVNPTGTAKDGPFQAYLGADGTSIWAAATSGGFNLGIHSPVAVHLLACMLARAWEAKVAISIWVELIQERQKEIENDPRTNTLRATGLMDVQQEISREQISLWDASARAWLRSADEAKFREQKKLGLITKNIGLPVSSGGSTYQKVIGAWKQAMVGFENIISGMPLQISDGTILLALSSWHLYPNLIILGGQLKKSQFNDELIPSSAVLTIGLSHKEEDIQAISWSLTLSHLYHYGDPISVRTTGDNTRVTMEQLHVVALAGLVRAWGHPLHETTEVADWILSLWNALLIEQPNRLKKTKERFPWLYALVLASRSLLKIQLEDADMYHKLSNFGHRRGMGFLGPPDRIDSCFGLLRPAILSALKESYERECGIEYLREVSRSANLRCEDCLICVTWRKGATTWSLYATAVPHQRLSQKLLRGESTKFTYTHARWIKHDFDDESNSTVCTCIACDNSCFCTKANGICGPRCHPHSRFSCNTYSQEIDLDAAKAIERGEEFLSVDGFNNSSAPEKLVETTFDAKCLIWTNPPPIYRNDKGSNAAPEACPSLSSQTSCNFFWPDEYIHQAHFESAIDHLRGSYQLYVRNKYKVGHPRSESPAQNIIRQNLDAATRSYGSIKESSEILKKGSLDANQLASFLDYFNSGSLTSTQAASDHTFCFIDMAGLQTEHRKAMRGLLLATQLYKKLEGATITLSIISKSLGDCFWIPEEMRVEAQEVISNIDTPSFEMSSKELDDSSKFSTSGANFNRDSNSITKDFDTIPGPSEQLSREETFSCIAMFEAAISIDPHGLEHVIAMVWENSIFVNKLLLADPSDTESDHTVKRIIGNVGRAGLTMMVAPPKPKIRGLSNSYSLVNHLKYDGKHENNFEKTSLHLSFTQWNVPLLSATTGERGTIDQDVFFLESIVSVHDQGVWVADLNILKLLDDVRGRLYFTADRGCRCSKEDSVTRNGMYASLDTWDELLDLPESSAVFRASGNWVARLAAVSILVQKAEATVVVVQENKICWTCLEAEMFTKMPVVIID